MRWEEEQLDIQHGSSSSSSDYDSDNSTATSASDGTTDSERHSQSPLPKDIISDTRD